MPSSVVRVLVSVIHSGMGSLLNDLNLDFGEQQIVPSVREFVLRVKGGYDLGCPAGEMMDMYQGLKEHFPNLRDIFILDAHFVFGQILNDRARCRRWNVEEHQD
eukprot:GABV01012133.1.p2 GENE.GABV01012133.1~~GABV01012133.1.p2  ORF type:complete len:104 (-),score=27.25 GABV01012133.1:11-322(-)